MGNSKKIIVSVCLLVSLLFLQANSSSAAKSNDAIADCQQSKQVPASECEALVALYNSTNGASWTSSSNWLTITTAIDVCNWEGIECQSDHVFSISLNDHNLTGLLPAQIGNLSKVMYIEIDGNSLTGSLPSEIGQLPNLTYFSVTQNQLTGSIPDTLGSLSKLETLNLNLNQFGNTIPASLGNVSSLKKVNFFNNMLSGAIPKELGKLKKLQHLDLGKNNLTGEIPSELGGLTSITELYLAENKLTGEIPASLGNLNSLARLGLFDNQLSGHIPAELSKATQLSYLNIRTNKLSGQLPLELGQLTQLDLFIVSQNSIVGAIPDEMTSLTTLDDFGFNDTEICVPNKMEIQNWIATIDTIIGTNNVCGNISGNVKDKDGNNLENVEVSVIRIISSQEIVAGSALTNENGDYEIAGVGSGFDYLVQFTSPDSLNLATKYYNDALSISTATSVKATANSTLKDINVVLDKPNLKIYLPIVIR